MYKTPRIGIHLFDVYPFIRFCLKVVISFSDSIQTAQFDDSNSVIRTHGFVKPPIRVDIGFEDSDLKKKNTIRKRGLDRLPWLTILN